MAAYNLEEQENIDDLKAWWAQYGNYVTAALTIALAIIVASQGWRWYQRSQAEQAGVLYQALSDGVRDKDAGKAKDAAAQLLDRFGGTAYAPRGALLYAKVLYDAGDKAGARTQYQWTIDHASEDELKAIARFRLAEALLDEKQFDEAVKTLDAKHPDSFDGIFADLKGDILIAAGNKDGAREAYQLALSKLDPKSPYRGYVQVKLDTVGGAR